MKKETYPFDKNSLGHSSCYWLATNGNLWMPHIKMNRQTRFVNFNNNRLSNFPIRFQLPIVHQHYAYQLYTFLSVFCHYFKNLTAFVCGSNSESFAWIIPLKMQIADKLLLVTAHEYSSAANFTRQWKTLTSWHSAESLFKVPWFLVRVNTRTTPMLHEPVLHCQKRLLRV